MTTQDSQIEALLAKYEGTSTHTELTKAIQLLADGILSRNTADFNAYKVEISARYIDQPQVRVDFTEACSLLIDSITKHIASKQEVSCE